MPCCDDFSKSVHLADFFDVVDQVLTYHGAKPDEAIGWQYVKLSKRCLDASLMFTFFEKQQKPHKDVADASHKALTSREGVKELPWSCIFPLDNGGSRLAYYGQEMPGMALVPIIFDIPYKCACLFQ